MDLNRDIDNYVIEHVGGRKVIHYNGFVWPNEGGIEYDDEVPEYLADDWVDACGVDEDDISERVNEDTAQLVEGDVYDWVYYEKYFIFDTDECRTFGY